MQQIYNANKTKIKDYDMSKESEKYKLFIGHPLYANWLSRKNNPPLTGDYLELIQLRSQLADRINVQPSVLSNYFN
jgi:hypothetical protein